MNSCKISPIIYYFPLCLVFYCGMMMRDALQIAITLQVEGEVAVRKSDRINWYLKEMESEIETGTELILKKMRLNRSFTNWILFW
ncbi:DNA replication licensing factor MCM6-like [Scyliorhinus canicula]|uniref:DNA replication licensing factor MCM6-like n=1 Tax=Scyliorhinus canicula TaxID=7830 RepID=UPI0018F41BEC|nr:DNA replication licensing factor MCM6-like [Scyliorhinus canicula]